jgi:hypothetical protein
MGEAETEVADARLPLGENKAPCTPRLRKCHAELLPWVASRCSDPKSGVSLLSRLDLERNTVARRPVGSKLL